MVENSGPMFDSSALPDDAALSARLGDKSFFYWTELVRFIGENYPGVFEPEWLFYGKKNGWVLRYKKSKSFCTLFPENNRLMIQIVFGANEREKAEVVLLELNPRVREAYESATTYHDGKWLFMSIESEDIIVDVKRLLTTKRKPKIQ